MVKADHRDAHKQLPPTAGDGRLAVVAHRNPFGREAYGCAPQPRLSGATATIARHTCFGLVEAPLAPRVLELSFGGILAGSWYYDDLGILAASGIIGEIWDVSAKFSLALRVQLKRVNTQRNAAGKCSEPEPGPF